MTFITKTHLSRRHFLRGTGGAVALPVLSAMTPAFTKAAASASPPRFVAMCGGLGFHAENFFPKESGANYTLSPYLEQIKDHRQDFTVLSGFAHTNQNGNNGHASYMTWLTSAQRPGLAGFKNTISLDQLIAKHIGAATRFPSLTLANGSESLSWTANGVPVPTLSSPAKLYAQLFIQGTPEETKEANKEIERGKSILDVVMGDAKKLEKTLGHQDKEKLGEYFFSVRDLETRLQQNQDWLAKPKPEVDAKQPKDITDKQDILAKQALMYDMVILALQTDSCRSITYSIGGFNAVPTNIPGVKTDWHNLSHHGKDEQKIKELTLIEQSEFSEFNKFLTKLKGIQENGKSLLDQTAVLFGSNLGNASSHSWRNLPILLAGGGFKHGTHIAHDTQNNTPFANLFVPLAQRMGLEIEKFGSSTKPGVDGLLG